jgi:NADPH:quinone reductase-like Zn-dependent oxidoreductase
MKATAIDGFGTPAGDVVDGQLTVPVQRTYALADVPRALADFAAGTRGKLAISVS